MDVDETHRKERPPAEGTCAEYRLIVSKAWDGEADDDEVRRLEEHLGVCERCRGTARRMRTFFATLEKAVEHLFPEETPRSP